MSGWRVFWRGAGVRPAPEIGVVIALESRTVISEAEARQLVLQLLNADFRGVSLRRPDSGKIVKGPELRSWLYPTA